MKPKYINKKEFEMQVTVVKDLTQHEKMLEVPEIRVWCCPHRIGKKGDDWFETFDSFKEAIEFIETHKEAERQPQIAFRGYEFNLYEGRE